MHSGPSIHGLELSPGSELGLDVIPDCCGEEMEDNGLSDGYRDFQCSDCETVLTVAPTGLVFDITS